MAKERLLTVPQFLAENKGLIGESLLYQLVKEGRIEHVRLSPRKILIPEGALARVKPPQE